MKIKRKLISGSFWFIMAVHLIIFTGIGFFTTKGWHLLIVFLSVLAVSVVLFGILRCYSKRHPEKRCKWNVSSKSNSL